MLKVLTSSVLLLMSVYAYAGADAIQGIWETEDGGYVYIHPEGDTWVGTVVGSRAGEARYDAKNPDENLRDRRLLGVNVVTGLKYDGDNRWDDGEVYSPDNGKTYDLSAELKDQDTLKVRGYIGISLLGRSQTWQRIDESAPHVQKEFLQ